MEEKDLPVPATDDCQVRAWEAPVIEELDFSTTEAAYGVPGTVEFGLYTT
jgi:hypothetical protein